MRALLMGGQACVVYGAAEFSRDLDLCASPDSVNLARLRDALAELRAEQVYFPPLGSDVLQRGHACHFRCGAPGVKGLRIDVMSVMRGAAPYRELAARSQRIRLAEVGPFPVVALPDLVRIKKTQRDKDWPMVRRLVEADIEGGRPSAKRIRFWLSECRSPQLLVSLAAKHRRAAAAIARQRPAVAAALRGDPDGTARRLREEEDRERTLDRAYWAPLRAELERWRLHRERPHP